MIRFSNIHAPATMRRVPVFSARQYSRRAFLDLIDPVLNIDWFEMSGPTFPTHPHAGFSAVTYLFEDSPNGFINRDSFGVTQDICPGGLHWSRASEGMLHEETPVPGAGAVRGLQIFVNLPPEAQQAQAAVFAVHADEVEQRTGTGWRSRVAVDGTMLGAATDALPSPVRIEEVHLDAGASRTVDVPAGWGGILIALERALTVDAIDLAATEAIGFAVDEAGSFTVAATTAPARFAIVAGRQLRQPIVSAGPLMTASVEALDRARRHISSLSMPA